jgi:hypothetical protein
MSAPDMLAIPELTFLTCPARRGLRRGDLGRLRCGCGSSVDTTRGRAGGGSVTDVYVIGMLVVWIWIYLGEVDTICGRCRRGSSIRRTTDMRCETNRPLGNF